jgi:hypothetical protein
MCCILIIGQCPSNQLCESLDILNTVRITDKTHCLCRGEHSVVGCLYLQQHNRHARLPKGSAAFCVGTALTVAAPAKTAMHATKKAIVFMMRCYLASVVKRIVR